jgi:diaminohydroxyphosphoribosylaminopyrimidine deaminase / 5-amino-6-(5-phosphoribosylamino)uracil reductase
MEGDGRRVRALARALPLSHPRLGNGATLSDEAYMGRALELAERGRGLASPNPMVGAVVVRDDAIVGEGWHDGPGTPHAEVVALREAGERARGSVLYTTLEPCDHTGRTPPCTEAIVAAGVGRVVSAVRDPHAIVDGRGIARLRGAGIEVTEDVGRDGAADLNRAFFTHVTTGRPFVVWKAAASLDGKTAARDGSSRWITGDAARADVHRLRGWADAIITGAGTVLADDPDLTVRDDSYRGRPTLRVLVDGTGRVEPTSRVFSTDAPTLVATTSAAPRERTAAWTAAGAEVETFDGRDEVDLEALVARLAKRDVQGVLLECGPTLAWSAVAAGLVDEVVLYVAPKLIGGVDAPGLLAGAGFAPIGEALELEIRSVERIEPDLKVVADVHGHR